MPFIHALADHFILFVFVLARVSGLFMTMPVFGTQSISPSFRAGLCVAVSVLIAPALWGTRPPDPGNLVGLGLLLFLEGVLGLAMGLSAQILFSGLQLSGQLISQVSGFSLADVYDPASDSSVPVFSQLLDATALMIMVISGGHRIVIDTLLTTFRTIPPGQVSIEHSLLETLTRLVGHSFSMGICASAPILISLLLAVLIIGLMSRTLPQLNTMNLGFSLNGLVLLGVLALTLGSAAWIFQEQLTDTLTNIRGEFFAEQRI